MKSEQTIALILGTLVTLSQTSIPTFAASKADSRMPRYAPAYVPDPSIGHSLDPKNVPDFANTTSGQPGGRIDSSGGTGTALKAEAASTMLPVETKLTLVLECPVDAKLSKPGDIFEAHTRDDLCLGTALLLPKGSLVRGRVADVIKPRLFSKAAKVGLKLEQIATPTGEVIPLDAALEFRKGQTNAKGQLDPGTSFGSRVSSSVRSVTGANSTGGTRGALMAANIATLGAPAAATLIGSSAIAIFRSGDNVSLQPGQELEVLLTNDLGVQVN